MIASTDKAYGDHASAVYDETTPLRARFPYDVSKACADLIAQSYAALHVPGTPPTLANLFARVDTARMAADLHQRIARNGGGRTLGGIVRSNDDARVRPQGTGGAERLGLKHIE